MQQAITDSLGRCIFAGIPCGYYQLILDNVRVSSRSANKEFSDSVLSNRNDFPKWEIKYPPNIEALLYNKPNIGDEPPYYQTHCAKGVIDLIRVAPDSIAIAKIATKIYDDSEVFINTVSIWTEEFMAKGGGNEVKNKDQSDFGN